MKYYAFTITTTKQYEDIVSDILICMGSEGVEINDPQELNDFVTTKYNHDYYDASALRDAPSTADELKAVTQANEPYTIAVRGFFADTEVEKQLLAQLDALGKGAVLGVACEEIDDGDYKDVWKQFYKPLDFGTIVVVPEWIEVNGGEDGYRTDKPFARLNPGAAFGTGSHETTALCLDALGAVGARGKRVADIGCGSGILGICAAVLGADSVYLTDIDGDALDNARHNARLNGVQDRCTFTQGDLLGGGGYDLIFANIVADILIRLSASARDRLSEGGKMILSGILNTRAQEVRDVYRAAGFDVLDEQSRGDWTMLIVARR